jgi:hypothetical protein
VDWTWKNRSVSRLFVEHTLLVSDVMVAIACAVRSRSDVRLIDADQILAAVPPAARHAPNPFKLKARCVHDGKALELSVIPDAVFGLDFTTERKRKYFFLEADRATTPIARSNLNQTSYTKKLLTYLAGGGQANAFGAHLAIGNFRLLTVTTSAERTANMIAALKSLTADRGSAQFLFAERAALSASTDVLSLNWLSGKNHSIRLFD